MPYRPTYYELANNRKLIEFEMRHPSWSAWLT
jgi:hypothetical protein